ncbi:MAG: tetratricopeptide repeat protein [Verrucomicrobiota bacterium]
MDSFSAKLIRWRWLVWTTLVFLCYANTFSTPFIFDDLLGIIENQGIRHLWPLWNIMNVSPDETPWGRPIVGLSLAINYAVSGLNIWSYRLLNIFIHLSAGFIFYELVQTILKKGAVPALFKQHAEAISFTCATLWLAHPLSTTVTTYTIQRAESLLALFYLTTLYFVVRSDEGKWFKIGAWCACATGMFTKEAMVTAPIAALLLDKVVFPRTWTDLMKKRGLFYFSLFCTWGILAILMSRWPRAESVGFSGKFTSLEYFILQWQIIVRYFHQALFPASLCLDYDWPRVTLREAWAYGAFLTTLGGISLWGYFKKPLLGFLGLFIFIVLAPTSSFIPVYTSVAAEHRMYLPLTAVIVLLVIGLFQFTQSWKEHVRNDARLFLSISCVLILCLLTFLRNDDFRSGVSIWRDVTLKQPENKRGWNYLGGMFYQQANLPDAAYCFSRSTDLDPEYAEGLSNYGVVLAQQGFLQEGLEWLRRSEKLRPDRVQTQVNLGLFYFAAKDIQNSKIHYLKALQLVPNHPQANLNLGIIYMQEGKRAEALRQVEKTLRANPNYPGAAQLKEEWIHQ